MISYYVEVTVTIDGDINRAIELDFGDAGDVGVNFSRDRIELCMTVDAVDQLDALGKAVVATRAAVHAAGGKTAGWERVLSKIREYKFCGYDERLFQPFGMAISGVKASFADINE